MTESFANVTALKFENHTRIQSLGHESSGQVEPFLVNFPAVRAGTRGVKATRYTPGYVSIFSIPRNRLFFWKDRLRLCVKDFPTIRAGPRSMGATKFTPRCVSVPFIPGNWETFLA